MYIFLLANRYLRTRFIALASVISVTLGVATMIIVNSVMSGFSTQMRDRIHNILADVTIETTSMDGSHHPDILMEEVDRIAGPAIEAMTPTVEVYGMMSFRWMGQDVYRPVTLIGILPESKDRVSPLAQYLLSRQEIIEDGEVVREILKRPGDPLDWSLSQPGKEYRSEWLYNQLYSQRMERLSRHYQQSAPPPLEGPHVPVEPAATSDLQLTAADGSDALGSNPTGTGQSVEQANSTFTIDDPFANAASEPTDPVDEEAPQPARIYVGAGLISFPFKDEEKTRTMWMAREGQDVILTTVKTGRPEPASFKATIVDVFKSGMSEYDSNLVFCNLEELQYVRGMLTGPDPTRPHENLDWKQGAVTTLQIKLHNYEDASEVVRRLRAELPLEFQVRTWEEKQGPLLEAVAVESAILNVLLFLIITVAGFGILAIFFMIVVEKTRDIGILKALGASSHGVMMIFVSYGLSLGVVGSGAGVILGLLFVRYINQIEAVLSMLTGHKVFDESIYYFHEIPTMVHPLMVCWVAVGAVAIAVLASVLPARRAAALHPVRALRNE